MASTVYINQMWQPISYTLLNKQTIHLVTTAKIQQHLISLPILLHKNFKCVLIGENNRPINGEKIVAFLCLAHLTSQRKTKKIQKNYKIQNRNTK